MTKKLWSILVLALFLGAGACRAGGLVIESLDSNGRLIFNELTNATQYSVEWASLPGGPWTNFAGAGLDNITATGSGSVTCAVPMFYRVVATVPIGVPGDMMLIPGGSFQMGDAISEGRPDELPVHSVYVDPFYMAKYEITNDEMIQVMQWAYDNGKLIVNSASVTNAAGDPQELLDLDSSYCRVTWNGSVFGTTAAKGAGYPCVEVSRYGAMAYCNYRSLMEGRVPCYDLNTWNCDWNAKGYRLPTEAEWEKAARGGLSGKRFPLDNWISHNVANYYSSDIWYYDDGPTRGYHPTYNDGVFPYTSPVGSFATNGYGLCDMAGNVSEWCWDLFDSGYYDTSPASNPLGGTSGSDRVVRGGSWSESGDICRVSSRSSVGSAFGYHSLGFRVCLPDNP